MEDLTFGEQVKIILSRKGMTIKELAESIEATTGKKMSRQNLTQRLGRDNFQEQDMRMISAILGCPFHLSIFPLENETGERVESVEELLLKYVKHPRVQPKRKKDELEDGVYQQVLVFDQDPPEEKTAETNEKETRAEAGEKEERAETGKKEEREEAGKREERVEAGKKEERVEANKAEERTEPVIDKEEDLLDLEVLDPEDSEDLDDIEILETTYDIEPYDNKEKSSSASKTRRFDKNEILAAAEKAERQKQASGREDSNTENIGKGAEERDLTIGELYMIHKELDELEETIRPKQETSMSEPAITISEPIPEAAPEPVFESAPVSETELMPEPDPKNALDPEVLAELAPEIRMEKEEIPDPEDFEPVIRYEDADENLELGEMNPYTGREYQTNSVRMHPSRIGYVQVYDRFQHGWTDMTEWAFLGYQERKKSLLGRDYEPPIYLD